MTVKVKVPQDGTVSGAEGARATAAVKATTLVLPPGVQASGGASDGLLTCSTGQFGFNGPLGSEEQIVGSLTENDHFNQEPITCPDAAKIGTVSIKTPLIAEELTGSVYLASQNTNPFGSPLVLYIFAEGPESKVQVKLAGEVKIDQNTGQLTSVFKNTPPVAFSELNLHLFDGPRASQSTPEVCGSYSASASLESGPTKKPNRNRRRRRRPTSSRNRSKSPPARTTRPAPRPERSPSLPTSKRAPKARRPARSAR